MRRRYCDRRCNEPCGGDLANQYMAHCVHFNAGRSSDSNIHSVQLRVPLRIILAESAADRLVKVARLALEGIFVFGLMNLNA